MTAWAQPFLAALPLYLALMARAAGGGLFAPLVWSRLPEILFALPFGLVLAVLWPAAYWIGRRVEPGINEVAEYLSGLCAGCVVLGVVLTR